MGMCSYTFSSADMPVVADINYVGKSDNAASVGDIITFVFRAPDAISLASLEDFLVLRNQSTLVMADLECVHRRPMPVDWTAVSRVLQGGAVPCFVAVGAGTRG